MTQDVIVIALATLAIQCYFVYIIGKSKLPTIATKTSYIKSLYSSLQAVTILLYSVSLAKSLGGLPVQIVYFDAETVITITVFTTLLLAFIPLKLTDNLIRKLKLEY